MVVDLSPVLDPAVKLAALVLTGVISLGIEKARRVLHNRFHMDFTAQQVQTAHDAADTAAGVLIAMLQRGEVKVHELHIDNPQVAALAATAINSVPTATGALGMTVPDMAHIIVGRVGKLIALDPATPTVPVTAVPDAKAA